MAKKINQGCVKKVNAVQKKLGTQRKNTLAKAVKKGKPVRGIK
jgi:hypothetical protein